MTDYNAPLVTQQQTPLKIIHHDDNILIIQTLAYDVEAESNYSEMMLEENQESYGAFNLGLHVADDAQEVLKNRCQLLAQLNKIISSKKADKQIKNIHWLNQVHGNTIVDIDNTNNNKQSLQPQDADALTTKQQGQALAIMTADCVPISLYCEETGQVTCVHAGWQGLANGIIRKSFDNFQHKESSLIQAWIGACISVDYYEVTRDVLDRLVDGTVNNFNEINKEWLIQEIIKPHQEPHKVWIDLPKLAKIQLQSIGVDVMTTDVPCSYENSYYYSHRRCTHKQQKQTGRMGMLICKL